MSKLKGTGESGVWSPLCGQTGTRNESRTRTPRRLSTISSRPTENQGKHTRPSSKWFADGATERKSKPATAKNISSAAKAKQMLEIERTAQEQALEKARDVLQELEGQKAYLTKETEILPKPA